MKWKLKIGKCCIFSSPVVLNGYKWFDTSTYRITYTSTIDYLAVGEEKEVKLGPIRYSPFIHMPGQWWMEPISEYSPDSNPDIYDGCKNVLILGPFIWLYDINEGIYW